MKTKIYNLMAMFFLASLSFGFTACSDDDENSGSAEDFVGTWGLTEVYEREVWNGEEEVTSASGTPEEIYNQKGGYTYVTFNADGNGGFYSTDGVTPKETFEKWKYVDNKIYFSYHNDKFSEEAYTVSFSGNTMTWVFEESDEEGTYYERKVWKKK